MRDFLLKTYIRFRHDDEGVTLVEYGIALVVALGVGGAALGFLADGIDGIMTDTTAVMNDVRAAQ